MYICLKSLLITVDRLGSGSVFSPLTSLKSSSPIWQSHLRGCCHHRHGATTTSPVIVARWVCWPPKNNVLATNPPSWVRLLTRSCGSDTITHTNIRTTNGTRDASASRVPVAFLLLPIWGTIGSRRKCVSSLRLPTLFRITISLTILITDLNYCVDNSTTFWHRDPAYKSGKRSLTDLTLFGNRTCGVDSQYQQSDGSRWSSVLVSWSRCTGWIY